MTGWEEICTRGRFNTSSRRGCGTPCMGKLGRPPLEVVVSVINIFSFFALILNTFYQSYLECVESYQLCYTSCMKVGVGQITLHLPACHSLKEKRQVLKSVITRTRQKFDVAI